ncbi:MAG: aldehyde ferredoxin oxidoreductase N-terminal domain-containing protein [Candidatus Hydrothermarchaeota archaeon]
MTYNRLILLIDLFKKEYEEIDLEDDIIEEKIGGIGINEYIMEKSNRNSVIIGTGPLTGSLTLGSCIGVLSGFSPVTAKLEHVVIDWHFSPELKFAGYDFLVIKNKSLEPVFLWIHDEIADIMNAHDYWGLDARTTTEKIRTDLGYENVQVLNIGIPGEYRKNISSFGLNYTLLRDPYALSAVFGEKNLKAVAVAGLGDLYPHDPEEFIKLSEKVIDRLRNNKSAIELMENGNISLLDGAHVLEGKNARKRGCFSCPVACRFHILSEEICLWGLDSTDVYAMRKLDFEIETILKIIDRCHALGLNVEGTLDILKKYGVEEKDALDFVEEIARDRKKYVSEVKSSFIVQKLEKFESYRLGLLTGVCPLLIHSGVYDKEILQSLIRTAIGIETHL